MTPPQKRDSETTRTAILDAAEKLFNTNGFGETATSAVASAAGVTKSLIHHHFGSKEELWGAVKRRRFSEYFQSQQEIFRRAENSGELLRESLITYFRFLAKHTDFARLKTWTFLENADEADDMAVELFTHGVEKLKEAQNSGFFRSDLEPEFILISFLSLVERWFLCKDYCIRAFPETLGKLARVGDLDEAYLDNMIKIFFDGVLPHGDADSRKSDPD